jgi:hypothetical protein
MLLFFLHNNIQPPSMVRITCRCSVIGMTLWQRRMVADNMHSIHGEQLSEEVLDI